MEPESNSDSEERKTKENVMVKRPIEAKMGKKSTKYSLSTSSMEFITHKARGITIDEAKILKTGKKTDIAAKSTETAPVRGKRIENLIKSCYSLRSGSKGMDIGVDVKPTMAITGENRKRKTRKRDDLQGLEEVCKRMRRGSNNDDKDGTGGLTT